MSGPALFEVAALQLGALMVLMSLAWPLQRATANSGWIDAVWAGAVGVIGTLSALWRADPASGLTERQVLVAVMVAIWSVRLGAHIVARTAAKRDDPRYAEMIKAWGADAPRQLFLLLLKQAVVTLPLVFSVFIAAHNPSPGLSVADVAAVAICLVAVGGEGLADRQLRRFIASGQGGVCNVGLWRYSRHPNYFFEWLFWCAYPIAALDVSGAYPQGALAILAPATMYWLLRYVSGVPPLEEHMLRKHGARYRDYQNVTNVFFPGVPRHD